MPLEDLLEHGLPLAQDRVAMAGDDVLKAPLIDPLDALIEPRAVARADQVPDHPLLPHAAGTLQIARQSTRPSLVRALARAAVLFGRGQIEEQVGLEERLGWLVEEHEFLIHVGVDQLILDLGVEVRRHSHLALVSGAEDGLEGHVGDGRVLGAEIGALLGQAVGADEMRFGIRSGPGRDEDVVLEIRRRDVRHLSPEGVDLGAHGGGQGDGGEDEEGAGGKFDCGQGGGC